MQVGWQQITWNGTKSWYYFDDRTGEMLTGWRELYAYGKKDRYHFNDNGQCDSSNC